VFLRRIPGYFEICMEDTGQKIDKIILTKNNKVGIITLPDNIKDDYAATAIRTSWH
jgi:hypothetical protein